jgi:transposase
MRRFVEGVDREQAMLFPKYLEDWIDQDNRVRAINAFVDKLDLSRLGFDGFASIGIAEALHLRCLNRVRSSQRLEREAARNVEVMWLTCRLIPDHKTIADFRKDNGSANLLNRNPRLWSRSPPARRRVYRVRIAGRRRAQSQRPVPVAR